MMEARGMGMLCTVLAVLMYVDLSQLLSLDKVCVLGVVYVSFLWITTLLLVKDVESFVEVPL